MFLFLFALIELIVAQQPGSEETSMMVNEYQPRLRRVISAYTNNIYLKERRIEPSLKANDAGIKPQARERMTSIRIHNDYVVRTIESPQGDSKIVLSDVQHFTLFRKSDSKEWSLRYQYDFNPDNHLKTMQREMKSGPQSLFFPYTLWLPEIDVRDLFHQRQPGNSSNRNTTTARLVAAKRIVKENQTIYRFYYHDGLGSEAETKTTIDQVNCTGFFDVSPVLDWVIVGGTNRSYSWKVTYEGKVNGIPAIKRVTTKTDFYDPYISFEVLEIEHCEFVNPAEFNAEYYGNAAPLVHEQAPVPYLYFIGLGALSLFAMGAGLIFVSRKRAAAKSQPPLNHPASLSAIEPQ